MGSSTRRSECLQYGQEETGDDVAREGGSQKSNDAACSLFEKDPESARDREGLVEEITRRAYFLLVAVHYE